jgi:putative redox protein
MIISKSGENNYLTELSNGEYTVFADTAEDSKYMHPPEFIETALSACMNITTRMVLDRMSLKYDEVSVKVSLERPSKEETVIKYSIDIKGDIEEETKKQVIAKVYNCPVRRILNSDIKIEEMN